MPLKKIKHKFYRYINRKDFLLAISLVLPSFIAMQLSSISKYLDDKKDFSKKQETMQISVEYVSYNDYIKYISGKNDDSYTTDTNNENDKNDKYRISNIFSKKNDSVLNVENINQDNQQLKQEEDKVVKNRPRKKVVEQKKEPDAGYFIVQANGKVYNPEDVRKTGKRQSLRLDDVVLTDSNLNTEPVVVGKIANNTINKETTKESLVNLFYSLLKIKKKKKINSVIYDTRYDAYGNIIKNTETKKVKKKKNKTKQKKKNKKTEENTIANEVEENKNKQEDMIIKITLDGKLQKNDTINSLQDVDELVSYDKNVLLAIKELEYNFEKCWNEYSKKYINTGIYYKYRITYNKDKTIQNVVLLEKNIPIYQENTAQDMLDDIKKTINECNIFDTENRSIKQFWKNIEITFQGAEEI